MAFLTMVPPWVVGRIVDTIADGTVTRSRLYQQMGTIALAAVVSYVLRVVCRMALFGASYKFFRPR